MVNPVTPIEIGFTPLVNPESLPQENPPIAVPSPTEVSIPVVFTPVIILHVIIPTPALNAFTK